MVELVRSLGKVVVSNVSAQMAHFSRWNLALFTEFIEKTGAFGHLLLAAIGEIDAAADLCQSNGSSSAAAVHAVDRAVAFWVGSLEGANGSGGGVLSYALADGRCREFKTCGQDGDSVEGTASVNTKLFALLKSMQDSLLENDCDSAAKFRYNVTQIMFIPIIQSTLLYALQQDGGLLNTTEWVEGAGAAYAATVLPMVASCSADNAETIYNNMRANSDFTADFAQVKLAFENTYPCLGLTCAEVGGIYNADTMEYVANAEPCEGVGGGNSTNTTTTNTTDNDTNETMLPTVSPSFESAPTAPRSNACPTLCDSTCAWLFVITMVMGLKM
jgi:Low iron-inducible periplasmic protein